LNLSEIRAAIVREAERSGVDAAHAVSQLLPHTAPGIRQDGRDCLLVFRGRTRQELGDAVAELHPDVLAQRAGLRAQGATPVDTETYIRLRKAAKQKQS
jgi:hypothetical protein